MWVLMDSFVQIIVTAAKGDSWVIRGKNPKWAFELHLLFSASPPPEGRMMHPQCVMLLYNVS